MARKGSPADYQFTPINSNLQFFFGTFFLRKYAFAFLRPLIFIHKSKTGIPFTVRLLFLLIKLGNLCVNCFKHICNRLFNGCKRFVYGSFYVDALVTGRDFHNAVAEVTGADYNS